MNKRTTNKTDIERLLGASGTQVGNTIVISGELTFDFNQMLRKCAGRFETIFGDAKNLIAKLKENGCTALTKQQILDLLTQGTTEEFYSNQNVWCYFCVDPNSYRNYMFSPIDGENRDNKYDRLRRGVAKFSREAKFDVYIVPCN